MWNLFWSNQAILSTFFQFFPNENKNCGHYVSLASTKIMVTMFACHLQSPQLIRDVLALSSDQYELTPSSQWGGLPLKSSANQGPCLAQSNIYSEEREKITTNLVVTAFPCFGEPPAKRRSDQNLKVKPQYYIIPQLQMPHKLCFQKNTSWLTADKVQKFKQYKELKTRIDGPLELSYYIFVLSWVETITEANKLYFTLVWTVAN